VLRLALAVGLAALLLSVNAGAARETSSFVFAVSAKGTPTPQQISCPNGAYETCIPAGTTYNWKGTVSDATAGLAGTLAGRCTASGQAQGYESSAPDPATATDITRTLFNNATASARCSFVLTFRHGSLSGTAVVTSALTEGGAPGSSTESVTLTVTRGTGLYAGRIGHGAGKLVTTVPSTTFSEPAIDQGPGPRPLIIPAVDTQSEAWHLTLR
jgi:hypothetical protein